MNSTAASKEIAKFSRKRMIVILLLGIVAISVVSLYRLRHQILAQFPELNKLSIVRVIANKKTIEGVMAQYGSKARERLAKKFSIAGIAYPPTHLVMLGLKSEAELEIYASDASGKLKYVTTYPIIGTSGTVGPKLRQGDGQMPEGFYRIQELEPNTPYHVAMRVNYPNDFDKAMGQADNRSALGGDIMIHGSNGSIGCLAMGDPASEDLFVLVHDTGLEGTTLIMSPFDFRKPAKTELPTKPEWLHGFYADLKARVLDLPAAVN